MAAHSASDTRTLPELVAALARRTSDGVLVASVAGGVAGLVAIVLFLRQVWFLTPVLLGLAAFGSWGIADRERSALGARRAIFRILRLVAVLIGVAAAAFAAVMLFALFVGTLQS